MYVDKKENVHSSKYRKTYVHIPTSVSNLLSILLVHILEVAVRMQRRQHMKKLPEGAVM